LEQNEGRRAADPAAGFMTFYDHTVKSSSLGGTSGGQISDFESYEIRSAGELRLQCCCSLSVDPRKKNDVNRATEARFKVCDCLDWRKHRVPAYTPLAWKGVSTQGR
jgi:hypothetical protein